MVLIQLQAGSGKGSLKQWKERDRRTLLTLDIDDVSNNCIRLLDEDRDRSRYERVKYCGFP